MEKAVSQRIARFVLAAAVALLALAACMGLTACSGGSDSGGSSSASGSSQGSSAQAPQIEGLTYQSTMQKTYAEVFDVFYYNDGYKLIACYRDGRNYLVVPEGAQVPQNLPDSTFVLQQPLDNIYLAATAAMSLFDAIDALSAITLTGTNVSGWNIQAPIDALNAGTMTFAGKYSQPDYEMFVSRGCDLAIESTMILHTPEVQEMIEELGIPVFIECSSYEPNPMGRTEWVKVYGAMLNKEDAANAFFDAQMQSIAGLEDFESTGKTVAFFSIGTDGAVVIRQPQDYIATAIDMAGGVYAFKDFESQGSGTTMSITMEDFYATAKDADYLVYNGTIVEPIETIDDLLAKSDTFADYKAVKEGHVWSVGPGMYQSTDKNAQMILDFNNLVTDGDASNMTFLYKVN